jgi:hypothetical protein
MRQLPLNGKVSSAELRLMVVASNHTHLTAPQDVQGQI